MCDRHMLYGGHFFLGFRQFFFRQVNQFATILFPKNFLGHPLYIFTSDALIFLALLVNHFSIAEQLKEG